jgi:hypothetical protein
MIFAAASMIKSASKIDEWSVAAAANITGMVKFGRVAWEYSTSRLSSAKCRFARAFCLLCGFATLQEVFPRDGEFVAVEQTLPAKTQSRKEELPNSLIFPDRNL